jgi:hypothetical protein
MSQYKYLFILAVAGCAQYLFILAVAGPQPKNDSLQIKYDSLKGRYDSLQKNNDSISSELYYIDIELSRYQNAYKIFSERNPAAANQYGTIISDETE